MLLVKYAENNTPGSRAFPVHVIVIFTLILNRVPPLFNILFF